MRYEQPMKIPGTEARDQTLVERSLRGDEAAYGLLIDRYGAVVRGIAFHHGARDDADDVTQEVFLRAWTALPQLQRGDRFGPWVAQIARNTGLSWSRRRTLWRQTESQASHNFLSDTPTPPPDWAEARQSTGLLSDALSGLRPEYRVLICLHYLEGCSYRQIARCLDMPVATVRWRVLQGMRRLRAVLPGDLASPPARPGRSALRRAVLGALAAGVAPSEATPPVLIPLAARTTWWWTHRKVVTGLGLSALVHLTLLEIPSWHDTEPLAVTRFGPRIAAPRWTSPLDLGLASIPDRWQRRTPQPLKDVAPPPELPRVATLDEDDAIELTLFEQPERSPGLHRSRHEALAILEQMVQRSLADTLTVPELELLRLQDLDRSGSSHGVVIIDPTDRRNLRGFVHFPSQGMIPGWQTALQAGRSVWELAEYLRFNTGLEARHYDGNQWDSSRRDEWLEFPILFNAPGVGPFARPDY
ncbi:MAG: hypothetical protein CME04_13185 [Gemmatimonadaceae bacterium]|nr:hypothetical protein [Gemmatimonadaceae bacterium]